MYQSTSIFRKKKKKFKSIVIVHPFMIQKKYFVCNFISLWYRARDIIWSFDVA